MRVRTLQCCVVGKLEKGLLTTLVAELPVKKGGHSWEVNLRVYMLFCTPFSKLLLII